MSREKVDLVERAFADWNAGGVEAMARYWDPDVVWHTVPEAPDAAMHHGPEDTTRFLNEVAEAFGDYETRVLDTEDHGDWVLARIQVVGTAVGSGVPLEVTLFHTLRVENGRLAEVRQFLTREQALKAVRG
jgi:ketosteroid isomerase-like protein